MLPVQFAERVLELEINLEENHSIETIKALNQLYGVIVSVLFRKVSITSLITNPKKQGYSKRK